MSNSYSRTSFFGGSPDIAPIVRNRLYCSGNEATLTECKYSNKHVNTCTYVAGGYCSGIDFSSF